MKAHEMKERLLTVENLSLSYHNKKIFRDINLHVDNIFRPGIYQGQVVALLGPSGIGKTQLFRCLAGLQPPSSGQVLLNEIRKPVWPGEVGVVFQSYPLFKHHTVWGNLMLAASKVDKKAADVTAMLDRFDLTDKKNLYPVQLSGGQRQRVSIIQQMLCSSHFILMDEPFSGLDITMKQRVADLIKEVSTVDEHNTLVITTHDIEMALAISDSIWVLGRERDAGGNWIPGSTVIKVINLIERELAWEEKPEEQATYYPTVREIRALFTQQV